MVDACHEAKECNHHYISYRNSNSSYILCIRTLQYLAVTSLYGAMVIYVYLDVNYMFFNNCTLLGM
jgi:hypothetical protein